MKRHTHHDKVLTLQPFKDGNKFATIEGAGGRLYVVWSYGRHWPLYIYDRQEAIWYENEDSRARSQSTRRHADVCRPTGMPTKLISTEAMRREVDAATAARHHWPLFLDTPITG